MENTKKILCEHGLETCEECRLWTLNKQECKCELDGFQGAIWKGDCPIHGDKPLDKQNMRERFDDLFYEEINSFMGTVFGDKMLDYAIKDFIESEINLALKEQKDEVIRRIDGEYIESCRYWNGIDECKNCGLSREGLEALFKGPGTG